MSTLLTDQPGTTDYSNDNATMDDNGSVTCEAKNEMIPVVVIDESTEPIDLSKITKRGHCAQCQMLSKDWIISLDIKTRETYTHHPSVLSLQNSVRRGCSFCMFVWKQLDTSSIVSAYSQCKIFRYGFQSDPFFVQYSLVPPPGGTESSMIESSEYQKTSYFIDLYHSIDWEHKTNIRHDSTDRAKLRPLKGNTGSNETMQQITQWLEECDVDHPECRVRNEDAFVPTRLIDVSQCTATTLYA